MMFGKQLKYHNKKVERHGIKFDSKREADRYDFLLDKQNKGLIRDLRCQVKYDLIPQQYYDDVKHLKTKIKIVRRTLFFPVSYRADFVYVKTDTHETVVEDCKISPRLIPKEYRLKEVMMHYFKRILIKRVYKANEPI